MVETNCNNWCIVAYKVIVSCPITAFQYRSRVPWLLKPISCGYKVSTRRPIKPPKKGGANLESIAYSIFNKV
jgi:hypothetical protein